MVSAVVLLIIAGCAAFQYFKGTIVRAFATIVIAVFASIVAFGFFEILADVLIKRGDSGGMLSLVPWAQALSFLLLFVLTFAILQTAIVQLTRMKIDLGFWPERIGRPVLGIILGLIVSGILLTFLWHLFRENILTRDSKKGTYESIIPVKYFQMLTVL
jgi:hypothetical protein